MTRYLIDTNVVSELRRSAPDPRVGAWFDRIDGDALHLSVLTVGEVSQGIARLRRRDPAQAALIAAWLEQLVDRYADRIWPVDAQIAHRWGELNAVRPLPVNDGLLAATAIERDAVLVTRNTHDLAGVDIRMVNPFVE